MNVRARRFKQAAQVGDWVKTERGVIFEITKVVHVRPEHVGRGDYGPIYYGDTHNASAMACAVVEIRRASRMVADGDWRGSKQRPVAWTPPDAVCQHGTAVDVHCCNCHSGFIFDLNHECPSSTAELERASLVALHRTVKAVVAENVYEKDDAVHCRICLPSFTPSNTNDLHAPDCPILTLTQALGTFTQEDR